MGAWSRRQGAGRLLQPPLPSHAAHSRVKIVDKRVEKGRVYLKKGTIVDVTSPQTCDVHVDDARVTVQVRAAQGRGLVECV